MVTKPDCPCFTDIMMRADREQTCDAIGEGVMHMVRLNADQHAICVTALPYLCGAVLTGLAVLVAQARQPDSPTSNQQQMSALDDVVALALERLNGARMLDLDAMPSPSERRN